MRTLHRFLPTRDHLHQNRWLKWLAPHLLHPRLWHFSRRGVAVGVGLGVFFGLLIPIAQIPFAAGTAVLLRANVPVAVGSTLVTNPVTFAPIYYLAHQLGASLLGEEATTVVPASAQDADLPGGWRAVWDRVMGVGGPLMLGLVVLAISLGLLTYWGILLFWRMRTIWNWKRRRRKAMYVP
jgi:uncharacterized protein (DUF2062 family)